MSAVDARHGPEAARLASAHESAALHAANVALAAEVDRLWAEVDRLRAEVGRLTRERDAYEASMIGELGPAMRDGHERPWQVWSWRISGRFRTEGEAKAWLRRELGLDGDEKGGRT